MWHYLKHCQRIFSSCAADADWFHKRQLIIFISLAYFLLPVQKELLMNNLGGNLVQSLIAIPLIYNQSSGPEQRQLGLATKILLYFTGEILLFSQFG